jgi:hypothetical protein
MAIQVEICPNSHCPGKLASKVKEETKEEVKTEVKTEEQKP